MPASLCTAYLFQGRLQLLYNSWFGKSALGAQFVSGGIPEGINRQGVVRRLGIGAAIVRSSFPIFVSHHKSVAVILDVLALVKEQNLRAELRIALRLLD